MNACGLVHSNRLTVPFTVTGFAMSYIAVEWCAVAGTIASSRATAMHDNPVSGVDFNFCHHQLPFHPTDCCSF